MEINKDDELYGGAANSLEFAEKVLENNRKHLKDVMKPAEKAADELEKATATEKVRLQGTKETKAPNLKPYTESIKCKDRKEIGTLIESAKREKRRWVVKRGSEADLKEGYRYIFYTTKLGEVFTESLAQDKLVLNEDADLGAVELDAEIKEEEPNELPSALEILKTMLDIRCEDGKVLIALKGTLDDEKASKLELELSDEESKALDLEFHDPKEGPEDEQPTDDMEMVEIGLDESAEGKDALKKERDELWAKMPDCTEAEIQRLMDIRKELGDDEFYTESLTAEKLEEASSAEKRAFKKGGEDAEDLIFGKGLARIKDPHERAMLLHQHRMEKGGKKMSDRPEVKDTLSRKLDQAAVSYEKKAQKMSDAGMTDEQLDESAKISLDDLQLFKPWGGAKDVWELIIAQDKLEALDKALEDMYPEGIKATDLNDLLWFEKDYIFDVLDLKPFMVKDDVIEAEPTEVETEVEVNADEK